MRNVCPRNSVRQSSFALAAAFVALLTFLFQPNALAQGAGTNVVSFAKASGQVMESEPVATLMVVRTGDLRGKIQVDLTVLPGPGTNYVNLTAFTNKTVIFSDYQNSALISVPLKDDAKTNTNQVTISFQLANPAPAAGEDPSLVVQIGTIKTTVISVVDNDNPYQFNFATLNPVVREGQTLTLDVTLAASPSSVTNTDTVSVDWAAFQINAGNGIEHPGSGLADPSDFDPATALSGTLTFGPNDTKQTITLSIPADGLMEFNEDFAIVLSNFQGTAPKPGSTNVDDKVSYTNNPAIDGNKIVGAIVTVLFNGDPREPQPAGAVDQSFNPDNVAPNRLSLPGANGTVLAVEVDTNDKIYVGGQFTAYNAQVRKYIARVLTNGLLDTAFFPKDGPDGPVTTIGIYREGTNQGKILIGGAFTSVNRTNRAGICRLMPDGSVDPSFNPGLGFNGPVYSVAVEPGGMAAIVGGDFTSYNGVPRGHVARIMANGDLDQNYMSGPGTDGPVFDIALQPVQGLTPRTDFFWSNGTSTNRFSSSNGFSATSEFRTNLALNAQSGIIQIDFSSWFDLGEEDLFDNPQPDRFQIIFNGRTMYDSGLTNTWFEVDTNGTRTIFLDIVTVSTNVGPTAGTNNTVTIVVNPGGAPTNSEWAIQTTLTPIGNSPTVIAGDFTTIDNVPASHIAGIDASGVVNSTFLNNIGTGADSTVNSVALLSDGSILAGGSFSFFNSTTHPGIVHLQSDGTPDPLFASGFGPNGPVSDIYVDSSQGADQIYIAGTFTAYNLTHRTFLARLFPNGMLDTSFFDTAYNEYAGFPRADGFAPDGTLSAVRVNSSGNVLVGGIFSAVGGGTTNRIGLKPRQNFAQLIGGSNSAADSPGDIDFADTQFGVDENGGTLPIGVERTNGDLGSVETLIVTFDGSAVQNLDYKSISNKVVFPSGNPQSSVSVPILDDQLIEGDEDFIVRIVSVNGILTLAGEVIPTGAALGQISQTIGRIIDNDTQPAVFSFSKPEYETDENSTFATIEVYRTGNTGSRVTVSYAASQSTNANAATLGLDFTGVTNTLVFSAGQTNKTFTVPIRDDEAVEPDEVVALRLFSPGSGGLIDTNANRAILTIIDNDLPSGKIDFAATNFVVIEGQTNAVLTLRRTGGNVGFLTVDWSTADGTALSPSDYTASSGRLTWDDHDISNRTITIPLGDDGFVEPDEAFTVALSNPSQPGIIGNRAPTTTVTIKDNDFYGQLSFSQTDYLADENGVAAQIMVVRRNGSAEQVSVNYAATNGTAVAGVDYTPVTGTLTFDVGETAKLISIPILDDSVVDSNKIVNIVLYSPVKATTNAPSSAKLTIVDNELQNIPAGEVEKDFAVGDAANGAVNAIVLQTETGGENTRRIVIAGEFTEYNHQARQRVARLMDDGTIDTTYAVNLLIDAPVTTAVGTSDGKVVIGGTFTNVDSVPVHFLTRLNGVGHLDSLFNTGSGFDNPVSAVAEGFVLNGTNKIRRIVVGGDFTSYNGVSRQRIAMLRDDGSLDPVFAPGSGPSGPVKAIVVQRDGRVIIAGGFTSYRGVPRNGIARLNLDGSLDTTFDAGFGVDGAIRSMVIDAGDKILIAGDFLTVSGVARHGIARLNSDGTLDSAFDPGMGANGPVYAVTTQADGKVLISGDFTSVNGITRPRICRFWPDGTVDVNINFGTGADKYIAAMAVQSDRKIVIGGGFTVVNGLPRNHVARIFGGSLSGTGAVEFSAAAYDVLESSSNAVVTVRRTGGTEGTATVNYFTAANTATAGSDYQDASGTITFGPGETQASFTVPILNDNLAEDVETVQLALTNAVNVAIGRQPVATLRITSDDSVVGFSDATYSVLENAVGGNANITIQRQGQSAAPIIIGFDTVSNGGVGSATPGADYTPVSVTITFQPGETLKVVSIPISDDTLVEGNENLTLRLTVFSGNVTLSRPQATLTIVDNDTAPGTLDFETSPTVAEGAGSVTLTVTRSSGQSGAVSVNYSTLDGSARAPGDYGSVSGTLSFLNGETRKTITIPIFQDTEVEGNESFLVRLSSPTGGGVLGSASTTVVTIEDDDFGPGSLDKSFDPGSGAAGIVYGIALQPDGKIAVAGDFTDFNNSGRPRLARVLTNGVVDTSFSAGVGPSGPLYSIAYGADGKLTVGGDFRTFANLDRLYVARVTTNGFIDTSMGLSAGLNASVLSLFAQQDTKVLAGGKFTVPANRAARINASGSLDVSFNTGSGLNGDVNDIELAPDGKVVVGGAFTAAGSVPRGRVARFLANGLLDSSFNTTNGANGVVWRAVPLAGGKVLIGGEFTSVNGTTRNRIARLNDDGTVDTTFSSNASVNGTVYAIAVQTDGKIVIGGDFNQVNGQTRNRIARLLADGTLDTSFNPGLGPDGAIRDIELQPDRKIVIAGAFTSVNGFARAGIARLNTDDVAPPQPVTITAVTQSASDLQITFASQVGYTYNLEGSSDFVTWTNVKSVPGAATSTTVTTSIPSVEGYRFFRIARANP